MKSENVCKLFLILNIRCESKQQKISTNAKWQLKAKNYQGNRL